MLNNKTILAVSIILLLIMLPISPVTANFLQKNKTQLIERIVFEENGFVSRDIIRLSEKDESNLEIIPTFIEKLQSAHTSIGIMLTIKEFFENINSDSPLKELFEGIDDTTLNPLGKRVFIVSYGRSHIVNPFRKFQINLLRPAILFWYYPGQSSTPRIIKDKTIIIDPYPSFDVKVLDGRQAGIMRRFIGVYIYMPGTTPNESYTFFIGYTYRVLGIDLSPFD